jgi:hypothetical protein
MVPPPETGLTQYLNIEFPEPYTAQSLTIALDIWNTEIPAALEVSADGRNYEMVREFSTRWPVSSVNFPKVTARYFRIRFNIPDPGGRLGLPAVRQGNSFKPGGTATDAAPSRTFPARLLLRARRFFRRTRRLPGLGCAARPDCGPDQQDGPAMGG